MLAEQEFYLAIIVQAKEQLNLYRVEGESGLNLEDPCRYAVHLEAGGDGCCQARASRARSRKVLAEANQLQLSVEMPDPPYIRTYLDDPRWGSDKHWEDWRAICALLH